jgi:hypothetical protein
MNVAETGLNVQEGDIITVFWGLQSHEIPYTGRSDTFHDEVRKSFTVPGHFKLASGQGGFEDFEFKKGETCNIVQVVNPELTVETWEPPPEEPILEPPPSANRRSTRYNHTYSGNRSRPNISFISRSRRYKGGGNRQSYH